MFHASYKLSIYSSPNTIAILNSNEERKKLKSIPSPPIIISLATTTNGAHKARSLIPIITRPTRFLKKKNCPIIFIPQLALAESAATNLWQSGQLKPDQGSWMSSDTLGGFKLVGKPSERLRCMVCFDLASSPLQHQDCGKVFCETCIRRNGNRPCPNCRGEGGHFFKDTRCKLNRFIS